ncbi:MAG: hypothetical protein WEE20_06255 [Bacteroidota bacterium]
MAIVLDIIGSMVIRGALVFVMLNMTVTLNSALYDRTAVANAKVNLGVTVEVMYSDILAATSFTTPLDSKTMTFTRVDTLYASSQTASIYGVLDSTSGLWKLYRNVDGNLMVIGNNLQDISFVYLTGSRTVTTDPAQVKSVNATLVAVVEGITESDGISGVEQSVTNELKVFPLNL